jgi:hypothetical protein
MSRVLVSVERFLARKRFQATTAALLEAMLRAPTPPPIRAARADDLRRVPSFGPAANEPDVVELMERAARRRGRR